MADIGDGSDLGFFEVPAQNGAEMNSHQQAAVREVTPSQTSLALHNTDILNEIFKHLSHGLESQGTTAKVARKTLLDATSVCRGFLEPAMAAMWRVLSSLIPLLRLLPSFTSVNDKFILLAVKPQELEKFKKRARHVQVLSFRPESTILAPFTYERLRQLHDTPILPALLKIHILDGFDVSSSLIPFFSLSPSVRSIELGENSIGCREFIHSFFASMTTQSPSITHLKICSKSQELDSTLLLELPCLQDLELEAGRGRLSKAFMIRLGRLSNLKTLTLQTGFHIPPMESTAFSEASPALDSQFLLFTASPPPQLFSQLESLRLIGVPDAILILLAYVSPLSLKHLDLIEVDGTTFIRRKNATLAKLSRRAQRLSTFTMNQFEYSIITRLSSLQDLHHLVSLDIRDGSADMTDENLCAISSSLPLLRRLVLPDLCHSDSPTLNFIWTRNMLPPLLECLKICVLQENGPSTAFPTLPNTSLPRAHAHLSLRQLSISSAFGPQPDAHVNHLSKLVHYAFPKLDVVQGYGLYAGKECWDRVNLFRATLREVCENLEQDLVSSP